MIKAIAPLGEKICSDICLWTLTVSFLEERTSADKYLWMFARHVEFVVQPRCKYNLKTWWENERGTFAAVCQWYKWSECAKVKGNTLGLFYDFNTCRLLVVVWWEQNGLILFIFQVLAFFSARLEQHPDQTLSVGVVLDVIKQGTLQWPRDRLKVTSLCSLKRKHCKVFLCDIKHLFR